MALTLCDFPAQFYYVTITFCVERGKIGPGGPDNVATLPEERGVDATEVDATEVDAS